jgi:phosphate:Na+ symporter
MLMGMGLLFYGLELMSGATNPLRQYPPFLDLLRRVESPVVGILCSAVLTALIHSSAATVGVIIVLASQGLLSLEAGIALVFGANIGTCVTALWAAMGKPREAVRAALLHILFKIAGVALWIGFIGQLASLVRWISPTAPGLDGVARLAAEAPRQIANAHTLFNVANTLLFIWFTGSLARLMEWIVPERPSEQAEPVRPKYLDASLLKTPELALDRVHLELGHLGERALGMVQASLEAVMHGSEKDLEALRKMDDDVDLLQGAIVTHLGQLSQQTMSRPQVHQLYDYMAMANYIENIGDTIETNLVEAGTARIKHGVAISESTQQVLRALHHKVCWAVARSIESIDARRPDMAEEVAAAKEEINRLTREADTHLSQRLTAEAPHRLEAFRMESDIVENLKRIYYFSKRIAKVVAEQDARGRTTARDGRPTSQPGGATD